VALWTYVHCSADRHPDACRALLAHRVAKLLTRAMREGYELDRRAKP